MNVWHFVKLISLLERVTKQYTIRKEKQNIMTSQALQMSSGRNSEEQLTLFAEDSHVNPLAWLENEKDSWMKLEELCSSRLQGQLNKSNHGLYSSKTLKGYYRTTKGERSELSSIRWMNSGTTVSGKCLTVKISESPKIGNVCSLSDIDEMLKQKIFSL